MSYNTSFTGEFKLNQPPTLSQYIQYVKFTKARHDGQESPTPSAKCGVWCDWHLSEEGTTIYAGNDGNSFYGFDEWLAYVIRTFIKPWGLTLNGEVSWQGEESGDLGKLVVIDNVLVVFEAKMTYVERAKQPNQ